MSIQLLALRRLSRVTNLQVVLQQSNKHCWSPKREVSNKQFCLIMAALCIFLPCGSFLLFFLA